MIWYDREGNRGSLTYDEFLKRVQQRVAILQRRGLKTGDRIATFSGNFPETALTYFAAWSFGVSVLPLNVGEDENYLRFIIANAEPRLIFTRKELEPRLQDLLNSEPSLKEIPYIVEPAEGESGDLQEVLTHWEEIIAQSSPETEALVVYTSGTTGNPKGVLLDHYNLLVDAWGLAQWHGIIPTSPMMCVLPIHHVNGTVVTMVTPLVAGSSFVLNERFSVHHFFNRIIEEKVEVVSVVPTLLAFLLEANAPFEKSRSRLRHIICGAGPLTVDLAMRFEERYDIPVAHGYGLSETTCYSCCLPLTLSSQERRLWLSQHGYPSIGPALPVNEMAIHDPQGKPLPAGEKGEIVIRGHNVMMGYYNNPQANAQAFTYGWFRSGDEGFWLPGPDGKPYYFITGRIKELIIRGGVNISPFEIDEVLMSIPGVKAGIAVGFTHDLYGEEVGAYVQRADHSAITEAEVIAICRKKLPYFKCPKVVIFGDQIPVTSTGKYQRNKLKPLFEPYRSSRFKE